MSVFPKLQTAGERMGSALSHFCRFVGRFTGSRRDQTVDDAVPVDPSIPFEPQASPVAGGVSIPNYELIRPIGHGAYGEVWLARGEIGVHHAIKVIHKRTFSDRSPFEREYRGILQYTPISRTHHGLVPILHVGRNHAAGFFYYVMELADCIHSGRNIVAASYTARTLAHELDTRSRLPARECLHLGIELCEALRYLHSKQLIHRDIKPANIIFVNGVAKLADVGLVTHLAEARRDPKQLGTEGFTPPEGPGTLWADVYSLGKVLCEASLGPVALQGVPVSLEGIDEQERESLALVTEIFFKACHDELNNRYQAIAEMQDALLKLQDQFEENA